MITIAELEAAGLTVTIAHPGPENGKATLLVQADDMRTYVREDDEEQLALLLEHEAS